MDDQTVQAKTLALSGLLPKGAARLSALVSWPGMSVLTFTASYMYVDWPCLITSMNGNKLIKLLIILIY